MRPAFQAVLWWERRRVVFNLALLVTGMVSGATMVAVGGLMVEPGQDFIEPTLLFVGSAAFAVVANAFYCVGWISELLWSGGDPSRTAPFRGRVFRHGTLFPVAVTLLPALVTAALWVVF
ncbi:hypothetical protein [Anaeromyxobacter terrae]|uniref:hypothetical protein n=1 Tax=Anaeromyxobacter terrae TaxID=2925406 RepID=UPI001F5A7E76|nr:hypothetical protein [Anaeromyxobacter sp. SG22]